MAIATKPLQLHEQHCDQRLDLVALHGGSIVLTGSELFAPQRTWAARPFKLDFRRDEPVWGGLQSQEFCSSAVADTVSRFAGTSYIALQI